MFVQPNSYPAIWTIGHSTRSARDFVALLRSAAITVVGDVRRFPVSRRFPQFNQAVLVETLAAAAMDYLALPELGGRRQPRPDSRHTAWRNSSFRAYADHMDSDAFKEGMAYVTELAGRQRIALMCSEAVWWRCHRGLIADYLKVRGHTVVHLLSPSRHEEHPYTAAARIVHGQLSYTNATT
jgi:uncharacterized protein (DUF488 family)